MAQIWPKFGRILPLQHFPPLCRGLGGEGGDRDISQDGCFEARLTVPAIKLPSLMKLNHQKQRLKGLFKSRKSIYFKGGHHTNHMDTWLSIFTSVLLWQGFFWLILVSPSTDIQTILIHNYFFCPTLGNSRQIWLFFVGTLALRFGSLPSHLSTSNCRTSDVEKISVKISLICPALEKGWGLKRLEIGFVVHAAHTFSKDAAGGPRFRNEVLKNPWLIASMPIIIRDNWA